MVRVVKVIPFYDLRLMVAPSLGEILVIFGELRGCRAQGRCGGIDDDLLRGWGPAPAAVFEAIPDPFNHTELCNTWREKKAE